MKLSWRVVLLWALPILVVGFFFWQGAFSTNVVDTGQNAANTRMTYGRFHDYLDAGRVIAVDLYDGGRTAIVEAMDTSWTTASSAGALTCRVIPPNS